VSEKLVSLACALMRAATRDMPVLQAHPVEFLSHYNHRLTKPVIDGVKTRLLRDRFATKVEAAQQMRVARMKMRQRAAGLSIG
jgi:hypothetical protein